MRFVSKLLMMAIALVFCLPVMAQQKINAATGINWVPITGSGTPASHSIACTSANYGQPYQNTAVTPNTYYTCGTDGWAIRSGTPGPPCDAPACIVPTPTVSQEIDQPNGTHFSASSDNASVDISSDTSGTDTASLNSGGAALALFSLEHGAHSEADLTASDTVFLQVGTYGENIPDSKTVNNIGHAAPGMKYYFAGQPHDTLDAYLDFFDFSAITTADKTISFPNTSGVVGILAGTIGHSQCIESDPTGSFLQTSGDECGGINAPKIGQYVTGNGTSTIAQYFAFPGLDFYGDSNMCGFGASDYTGDPSTPASLGAALGFAAITGPDYGGTSFNYCITGAFAADVSTLETYQSTVSYTRQSPSLIVAGTNDANFCGLTDGCENNFKAAMAAAIQWRGIPTSQMITAASMTKTGTWTTDTTVLGGTVAAYSNTANATASATITTYGQPIMIGYMASATAGGAFTVQIDGGTACTSVTSGGFNGQSPTTNLGTTVVLFATMCSASAGTHTVLFTKDNTTNYGELAYVTTPLGNPGYTPSNQVSSPPQVYVGSVIRQYLDANSSATATYDGFVQTLATTYTNAGINVSYVNMRTPYINAQSSTDMNCGASNQALHLCDLGYVQQRDAFEAQVIPLNQGAGGGSGGCTTNCTFNGITHLVSNIANNGVADAENQNTGGYSDFSWKDSGGTARLAAGYANNASDPNIGGMSYFYSTGKDLCLGATNTVGGNPCSVVVGNANGVFAFEHNPTGISVGIHAITGTLTPGLLAAGGCSSATTTVTGATVGMVASINYLTAYPGDGVWWEANVTAANTVTVRICAAVAGTPNSTDYRLFLY